MSGLGEYVAMGGYAAFVWGAYGVAAVVLIGIAWASARGLRRRRAELSRLEGQMKSEDRP